jgi:C-terminal peptidase prc
MVFARVVYAMASQVTEKYIRPVEIADLVEGAVRGLYEEAGLTMPDDTRRALRRAADSTDRVGVLADARLALGKSPALTGPRAVFAAVAGFRHATDPNVALISPRTSSLASVEMDFRIGVELDGVSGTRWALYQLESGRHTGIAGLDPAVRRDAAPPATFPWRVKKVVPGSPAQRAGVRPGDVITHFNGAEVTPATAGKLFTAFAYPPTDFEPNATAPVPVKLNLRLRREGHPDPIRVELKTDSYNPESVFGVMRLPGGKWDCMLDREHKIGYVRVGPIESAADERLADLLAELTRQGCRGLILDLRWCPGGYVIEGSGIAGLFLPEGTVMARLVYRDPNDPGNRPSGRAGGGTKFLDVPLVVLVGSETTGGGELIAAALQDNKRATVIGQRTVGRAYISQAMPPEVGGLQFGGIQLKLTTGLTLRANGRPRHRLPNSQPTDEWGVRPEPGFEVPVTADVSAELGRWAELHALRPAESREALPFDDPAKDPFRLVALGHLRRVIGRGK